jgi:senataxin
VKATEKGIPEKDRDELLLREEGNSLPPHYHLCFKPISEHHLRTLLSMFCKPIHNTPEDKEEVCHKEGQYDSEAMNKAFRVLPFKDYLKVSYNILSKNLCNCIELLYSDHPRNSETGQLPVYAGNA